MWLAIRSALSLVLGFALLIPLGAIYGIAGLPVYHSWGLTHGSFTTALPAFVAVSFILLGLIPRFGPVADPAQRVIAAISVIPLVTVLFAVDQVSSDSRFSFAHASVYAAAFCVLVALCVKSKKPLLIPLFLLVPLLIDPVFGLALTVGHSAQTAFEIFTYDLQSKILPVVVACAAALGLARYVHVRKA